MIQLLLTHCHDDVFKWKHFPRYWPFVRGIHRSPVNSLHKGQWRGALMFSLIWAWINGWIINYEAGDLRHHRAQYDVIVMVILWHHMVSDICVNIGPVMACHLSTIFSIKPLTEPMLFYCHLGHTKNFSGIQNSFNSFHSRIFIWNWHFVLTSMWPSGLILGLRPANERCRSFVTMSLIGGAQT